MLVLVELEHKHIASTRENNDICYNTSILIKILDLATDCTVFEIFEIETEIVVLMKHII